MKVTRFDDPVQYHQKVEGYLIHHEATHCLLLGISKALCSRKKSDANLPYLIVVHSLEAKAETTSLSEAFFSRS